jgi:hypothetical protein
LNNHHIPGTSVPPGQWQNPSVSMLCSALER